MQRLGNITVGETVPEQFKADLKLELENVTLLREATAHCAKAGNFTTQHKLEDILQGEENYIDWIETQQETIKEVGLEVHLSEQIKKDA